MPMATSVVPISGAGGHGTRRSPEILSLMGVHVNFCFKEPFEVPRLTRCLTFLAKTGSNAAQIADSLPRLWLSSMNAKRLAGLVCQIGQDPLTLGRSLKLHARA